jgi:DNA mismatch endonuclease (patch repair protein)
MTDVFTKKKRSWVMSRIKNKNTKIENLLASKMSENDIGFKRYPKIFGNPDFMIKNSKIVIFIDGCFWHKCPIHYREPRTKKEFWLPKIKKNVKRDKEVNKHLKKEGYHVIRFWEHDIEKNSDKCIGKLLNFI